MSKKLQLGGKVFGRLVAQKCVGSSKGEPLWECKCQCGGTAIVHRGALIGGRTKSCGCLNRELSSMRKTKHGHASHYSTTPEYRAWTDAQKRCHNPKVNEYHNYGWRGIRVCDRWLGEHGFENFLADMGPKPDPKRLYSLDRFPNNDGNYEPGNCRWATREEQFKNRSKCQALYNFSNDELLIEVKRRNLI